MTEVTGRHIAYTCIIVCIFLFIFIANAHFHLQTRIALRGKGWTLDDGAFEYGVFYQNIVRMFESDVEADAEWIAETLAWWNE